MPPKSKLSSVGVSDTFLSPSLTTGNSKVPTSSRLYQIAKLSSSHQSSLTRSRRRLTKMNSPPWRTSPRSLLLGESHQAVESLSHVGCADAEVDRHGAKRDASISLPLVSAVRCEAAQRQRQVRCGALRR